MAIEPEFASFARIYETGAPQAVHASLPGDLETAVSLFLKLGDGRDNSFLLESIQGGESRGRYSIIGIRPDLIWRCRSGKAEINRDGLANAESFEPVDDPPLNSLRNLVSASRMALPPHLPPMAVGLFGYLGYDMVRLIERLGDPLPDLLGLPDAVLIRPTVTAIFDNVRDEITIVTPVWPQAKIDAHTAYARACERLNETLGAIRQARPESSVELSDTSPAAVESNTSKAEYLAMVERAKEYIRAGDI